MSTWKTRLETSIAELSRALIYTTGIEDISSLVSSFSRDITHSMDGYAGYINQTTGRLVLPTVPRPHRETRGAPDTDDMIKSHDDLWSRILENNEPLLVNALSTDAHRLGILEEHIPIKRFLSVPVRSGNGIVGLITVANKQKPYLKREQQALERYAELYALAIERKQSERDPTLSDEHYKAIAETSSDGIITTDAEGTVLFWNKAAEHLFGFSDADIVGKSIAMVIPTQARNAHMERLEDVNLDFFSGFSMKAVESKACKKDGTEFDVEVSTSGWTCGNNGYFSSVVRDITRRKEMEEALHRSKDELELRVQERTIQIQEVNRQLRQEIREREDAENALREQEMQYRLTGENIPVAVYSALPDAHSTNLFITGTIEKITGHPARDFLADPELWFKIIHPDDREYVEQELSAHRQDKNTFDIEYRIILPDNTVRWVRDCAKPVVDYLGNLIRIDGFMEDIGKRKEAEGKYSRLVKILETTNDFISTFTPDGKITYLNVSGRRLIGLDDEESIEDKCIHDLHPPWAHDKIRDEGIPAAIRNEVWSGETALLHCDGREIPVLQIIMSHKSSRGELEYLSTIIHDISYLKKTENALRKSEERFRTVADFTHDWEYWIGPDGKYIYISPSFERITGYRPQELMNEPGLLARIIHPDDRTLFAAHLLDEISGKEANEFQFRIVHRRGDVRWIGHICQPVFNADTKLLGRRASNRDITEQKLAEENLRKSEERLALTMKATNDGMWDWNVQTGAVYFNPTYYTMLGYEPNELPASFETWHDLLHPDDRERAVNQAKDHLETRTEYFEMEFRMKTKAGAWKWLLGRGKVVERDTGGRAVRMVGTHTDISRRKDAEEALRRSEARYRDLFESSRDAIGIIDLEGTFINCNSSYAKMLGYPLEELKNITYRDITPEKWRDWEKKHIVENQILKRGYSEVYEKEYIRKDGTVFPVELRASLLKDENDRPYAMWGFARDITERKQTEENLRRDQAGFGALYSLSGMIDKDEKQIMDYALEAGIHITGSRFGYLYFANEDETKLTLHAWSKDVMEACRVPHKQTEYKVKETGLWGDAIRKRRPVITNDYDEPNPSKKGYPEGHVPIKRHMNIPLIENGKVVLIAGVANKEAKYDINDTRQLTLLMDGMWRIIQKRRADRSLEESEEKLSGVVNSLPDLVFLIDAAYTITWANDFARTVYGDSVTGKKCFAVLHGCKKVPDTCTVKKALKDGKRHDEELRLKLPDDSIRDFWVTANIAGRHPDGRPRLIVYILRDITDMRKIQSEAVRASHLASIGELAAGVAHEINNPINGIINYAEIIKEEYAHMGQDTEIPVRIAKEGERVAAIVKNLLSFSRQQKKEVQPVYIRHVLDDALALTSKQLQKDDIVISVKIPDSIPVVPASAHQLQQVFINIITNARYALNKRPPDRTDTKRLAIEAETRKHGGGRRNVTIIFRDNGIGIPEDIIDRVCDPFFSTKATGEGTGLGLSISHGIVQNHGGTLTFDSRVGEYTRVILELPAAEKHTRAKTKKKG